MTLSCKFRTSQHKIGIEDYITMLIASLISCAGFCTNSETTIIGSMLISNLTKPFTNFIVAFYKKKWKVTFLSSYEILKFFSIVVFTSIIWGVGFIRFKIIRKKILRGLKAYAKYEKEEDRTPELMNTLSEAISPMSCLFARSSLIYGFGYEYFFNVVIAIGGGILLARSHCKNSTLNTAIIGIGIATSILPPMVAAGIFTGIGLQFTEEQRHAFKHARYCVIVTALNLVCIYLAYWATLHMSW